MSEELFERDQGSEALNQILGQSFKVLDDGFIRVVDYMGSDAAIVQAARVSYGKGTKKVREDESLIRYLLRHHHSTPFEMCEIKLHIRVPMDTWRQWIRHRTANVNEYSTRYSVAIDAAQTTLPENWRIQTHRNKQGSEGMLPIEQGEHFSKQEKELQDLARSVYDERIEAGIAREQARKDLPLSTYTEAYWKIDLSNLLHFCALRMEAHAQEEIREYATVLGEEIVSRWVPLTWQAFKDYRFEGMSLSLMEQQILSAIANGQKEEALRLAESFGWMHRTDGKLKQSSERMEFEHKLERMQIAVPWSE